MSGFVVLQDLAAQRLWSLVASSSFTAQVVLAILLLFSIVSCGVMIAKWRLFRRVQRQSFDFYEQFRKTTRLSELLTSAARYPQTPLAGIFKAGYQELNRQIQARQTSATSPEQALPGARVTVKSVHGIERVLRKQSVAEMALLERSLPFLATTATVTPFIGLFGTVIGIINAFAGLSSGAQTTLQAVAPGLSEALVTTAAGLFAAIPAVIGYNQFVSRLKLVAAEMDDFSAEFMNLVERNFT